ncbi:MAG: hypothetical protein J6Z31_08965 [Fibrobacter sp.]|nr:hypothetical protein [Fibrobacter sp.]
MSRSLRILLIALAAFFCFMASYLFLHTLPFYKSFFGEEDLFYGKISSVSIPRGWSGTGVPLFDKTYFSLNEDRAAVYILSLPAEQNAELANWISFWAETGAPAPIEVRGVRVSQKEWIVTGLQGNDGALDASEIHEFHLRSVLWSAFLNLVFLYLSFLSLRRALRRKK